MSETPALDQLRLGEQQGFFRVGHKPASENTAHSLEIIGN